MTTGRPPVWQHIDPLQLLAFHHATFGDARMEETDAEKAARETREAAAKAEADRLAAEPKFSQAELDRIATREKQQGKDAAIAEIAATLGMTVEEAKAKLEKSTEAERAAMTEADRKTAEAADAKTKSDQATAVAQAATHATVVERHLHRAGLTVPDKEGDAFITRAVGLVGAKVGADEASVKSEVDKLKELMPALFTAATDDGQTDGGNSSDPGAGPTGRQQSAGAFGKEGVEEFDRRFPKAKQPA